MQLADLLNTVQYVTNSDGQTQGILLDLDAWQKLIELVEEKTATTQVEPKEVGQVSGTTREAAMLREEAAFRRLHTSLYEEYAGQYVAIYNEQLVDSDSDQASLYLRMRKRYPQEFVWIAPVNESPDEVVFFRSPRLLNSPT